MSYTIKYYSFQGLENNMTVYEEDINGANPGIEWGDTNGNTFRSVVVDIPFSLNYRTFQAKCFKFVQPKGLTNWSFVEEYVFNSNDNIYLDSTTGQDTTEGAPNAIQSSKYFINNIGKNLNNLPLSLYKFFTDEIIQKEQLTA